MYTETQILSTCRVTDTSQLTTEAMANFCRGRKRKTKAAIAVANGMTAAEARAITPVSKLLALVSS